MIAACIEHKPTPQSVCFNGTYLNLSALARDSDVHPSTVSRIFNGTRKPSLNAARKLSMSLGMSLDEFIVALDNHIM
jgi:transcriptional regulator with XRE-family HTH domain